MPHDDDTPDVEHLLFSDLTGLGADDRAGASDVPPGPLAIYMGCHPAAGRRRVRAACEEPETSTAGEDSAGGWAGLTLETPWRAATLAWTWLDPE
jgi:hypothetical protein